MWDGPGPGPRQRGGPHFRGDHSEDMFGGKDRPMPDFRGRDGMNMGPMGPMGARHFEMPPMDMRRMDGPPMRGRDMESRDMGRREFFRHGEEQDLPFRRQVEISFREKMVNTSNFGGPGRNPDDMGGKNMPQREGRGGRFTDMDRDRDGFEFDRQPFHNDGRRGFPMDQMERNDGFRDQRERSPMGMRHNEGYDNDMPERRMMDMDRRGGPPFNSRGGFESDMDFRNRSGPGSDFRGRGRSPPRFGNDPVPHNERGRPGLPQNERDTRTENMANNEGGDSPLTDYRCGEEMTLAEEWKNRNKEKKPLTNFSKGFSDRNEPKFPLGFGRDGNVRDPPPFPERDRMPLNYPPKDFNFPPHFPPPDLPGRQEHMQPHKDRHNRENESKPWLEERDPKPVQPNQEKTQPPPDCFKDHIQGTDRTKLDKGDDFSSCVQPRDQDYRDIDYRTASRTFDFKPEDFQTAEKLIKESKPPAPSRFTESTSQDQDYRGAAVEDQMSNTVSITGIPKTATVEQILGAFTTPDGVPIQGMKIKNVVPGYSYDTAIVEFLNLEDAVHFMESNKGSLKVGARVASMKFVSPEKCERTVQESDHNKPPPQEPTFGRPNDHPEELKTSVNGSKPGLAPIDNSTPLWQRSSDLTPEAWQRQVDQQQEVEPREPWSNRNPPFQHQQPQTDSVFKDSKTMIIKNVKPTTTIETILKALDPFAYLDERNVRLVKAKTPGAKCFCFVDMDSHEQVQRLVELLTKPRPLYIDGVRVYAEVAKPLKNQAMMNRKEFDNPSPGNSSILGNPPQLNMVWPPPPQQQPPPQQPFLPPSQYMPPIPPPVTAPTEMQGGMMPGTSNPPPSLHPSISQGVGYGENQALNPLYQPPPAHVPTDPVGMVVASYAAEAPDISNYLYDATSGFYYDPETTLYYDPNSRYFYNAETQEYLYWEPVSKTYIPVPGGQPAEGQAVGMTAEDQAILSNPAADAPLEMKKPPATVPQTPVAAPQPAPPVVPTVAPEPVPVNATVAPPAQDKREEDDSKKDKDNKDEKPKSRAAVKIMKDMERWAKIQNRQKESVRTPSPLMRGDDDKRQSKSADAGFAIFERKISGSDELFKKPFAPSKKDEKSKRSMGSLGMLASDYGAGSDEEVEDDKEEPKSKNSNQNEQKEDKLTDWKKMACLLCRRQFPNKDALIRHQQLSDLHKQNMEIHLKIKRSKKELEALENQEKELNAQVPPRSPPETKRRKQPQQQDDWAGGSRESNKGSERPGLGAEPAPKKKKKPAVYDHASYQQAVRKAMFARYKELE